MRRTLFLGLALSVAIVSLYWPVSEYPFIALDDPPFITANPHVKAGLSWDGLSWAFHNDHWSWHPLTWLSHQLDCQLYGLDPTGHHVENLALHVANTLLLLAVLRALTGSFWCSAVVAAAFALHPLRVESVAWAAERKGLLSTWFGLATIGAWACYARRPHASRYLLVVLLFALCLLSKAMLVTLPFLLLVLDVWPLGRLGPTAPSRLIAEKVPLILLAAVAAVLALRADPEPIALSSRLLNALVSYSRYLEKLVWPFGLALPYPYPDAWPLRRVVLSAAVLLAPSALAAVCIKRRPYVAVGWLWYLGTLVPVIGLVQSGVQSMADRFSYFPSIGILLALAFLADDATRARPIGGRVVALGFVVLLAGFWLRTADQLGRWRSTVDLFTHSTRVTEDNFQAHAILGAELLKAGDPTRARPHIEHALRLRPDEPEVQLGMGNLMIVLEEPAAALRHLRRAVEISPNLPSARISLGLALLHSGDADAAIEQVRAAIALAPDQPEGHFHLGLLLATHGRDAEAADRLYEVLRIDPAFPGAATARAQALVRLRRMEEAAESLSWALRADPDDVTSLLLLARILAAYDDEKARDGARALVLARRACELTAYRSPVALDVLAAALAELGQFEEAAARATDAARLAQTSGDRGLAAEALERAELYRRGIPHRQR